MKAKFIGRAVAEWLPSSPRKMKLEHDFSFVDALGFSWDALKGDIVDGASIPTFFWYFIGSPFIGKYRRASIIHDVYCQSKSMPHKQVHKMFYQAMRVDKVNYFKAKSMYYAVRLGGPTW